MSRLRDLIARHCPKGVPFQPLGEIGTFTRGRRFTKEDVVEQGLPSIHDGEIYTHYGTWALSAVSHVRSDLRGQLRFARPGDVIFAGVGETVEEVAKAVAWLGSQDVAFHDDCFAFRHEQDPKYIAYAMQASDFHAQKNKHVARAKVKRLSGESLAKIKIPVPPVLVQQEIARVLDLFAELEAKLEAELEAELRTRRQQYSHYRDSLLTFPDETGVRSIPMDELAEFMYGFTASAQDHGEYRFLRITDINAWGKLSADGAKYVAASTAAREYLVKPGDLLMARTGSTFGKTMLVTSNEPSAYASFLIRIRFRKPNVLPAYYWHFAQSTLYWSQANAMVSRGGQPQFNANVLKLVKVPIPPIEEQRRIVSILDKFDALVNELSVGLPAEIRSRRQQYEYYRDQLLTFKEAA